MHTIHVYLNWKNHLCSEMCPVYFTDVFHCITHGLSGSVGYLLQFLHLMNVLSNVIELHASLPNNCMNRITCTRRDVYQVKLVD